MRDVPYLGTYRDLIAHADSVELAPAIKIPTLNLESLIRSKELGGRKKDEEVVEQLRAVRALRLAREAGVEDIAEGIVSVPNVGLAKNPRRKLP